MRRQSKKLSIAFSRRARELNVIRRKMEDLLRQSKLNVMDVEEVYAGIFLDIFTEFEALIEKLFLGLLSKELYSVSGVISPKIRIKPNSMLREVVFSGRAYLDWLPYGKYTTARAGMYFTNGEPFTLLSNSQRGKLDCYGLIRNALAHKSDSATRNFENFISGLPLLPREKTPMGYLRSVPRGAETQYEIAVIELEMMANTLCA